MQKKTTTNKRNKNNRKKYANVEGKISSHKTCTLICLYKHFVHVLKQTLPPIKLKKKKKEKKNYILHNSAGQTFFFILQSAGYHDSFFFFTFDFIVYISNCLSRNNLPTATNVPQLIFSLKVEVLPQIGELIFYGLEMKIELSNFKMLMTVVPAHNTLRMKTINI